MGRLNPYDKVMRKAALDLEARRKKAKAGILDAKRGVSWCRKIGYLKWFEPYCQKTSLWGFLAGQAQASLYI